MITHFEKVFLSSSLMIQKSFQNLTACHQVTLWALNDVGLETGEMLGNEIVGVRKPIIVVGTFYLNQDMQRIMQEWMMLSLWYESSGEKVECVNSESS